MTPFEQSVIDDFDRIQRRIKAAAPEDPDFYFNTIMFIVSASLGCACGVLSAVENKSNLESFDFVVSVLRDRIAANAASTANRKLN